jgi:peptidoglycan hydrolase-like protein with peptidoglycan-binding domain
MALLNGRLPDVFLKPIGWSPRSKGTNDAARALTALGAAFKRDFGYYPSITDSYRTYAQQVAVKAAKGYLAATPGRSNHGWGTAFDLGSMINVRSSEQHRWMQKNAKYFGFDNPNWATPGAYGYQKDEPWHWEYVNKSKDGSRQIAQLQKIMRKARLYDGIVDGWWGDGTEAAWDKLMASINSRSANPKRIKWFQKILASPIVGRLYTGEYDGIYGPLTRAAAHTFHSRYSGVK